MVNHQLLIFIIKSDFLVAQLGISVNLEHGLIQAIDFTGDFLGLEEWRDITDDFTGIPFTKQAVLAVLEQKNQLQYFGTITNEEIVSLIEA